MPYMPFGDKYAGLNKGTISVDDDGLNLEELDIEREMSLKVKRAAETDFKSLGTNPDELEDMFLVMHYKVN